MAEIEVDHVHETERTLAYGARRRRDVSWGAILAGVVIALGTMLLLSLLGTAIGMAAFTPSFSLGSLQSFGIGAAVFYAISKLISLFVGGYSAAKLSANLDKGRALLHGAAVWALTALGSLWLASSGIGNAVSGATSAVGSTASAVASLVPEDIDIPDFNAPDASLEALPPRLQRAIREQGLTADDLKAETRAAYRDVISRQEQRRIRDLATNTAVDVVRSPGDAGADIDAAIDRLVGRGGILSNEDRREFREALRTRLGVSASEAEQIAENAEARAERAATEVRETAEELRMEAKAAADQTTDTIAQVALWSAIALLLGLLAALFGAATGRQEKPVTYS